jgi:hypothetical protein
MYLYLYTLQISSVSSVSVLELTKSSESKNCFDGADDVNQVGASLKNIANYSRGLLLMCKGV